MRWCDSPNLCASAGLSILQWSTAVKTLEEIIIERGNIEKLYRRDWNVTLWRAVAIDSIHGTNPLYPDLTNRVLLNGRPFCPLGLVLAKEGGGVGAEFQPQAWPSYLAPPHRSSGSARALWPAARRRMLARHPQELPMAEHP